MFRKKIQVSNKRFAEPSDVIDVVAREIVASQTHTEEAPKKRSTRKRTSTTKKEEPIQAHQQDSLDVDSTSGDPEQSAEFTQATKPDVEVAGFVISKPKRKGTQFHKPTPLVHNKPQQVMTQNQLKMNNIFLRNAQVTERNSEGMWSIPLAEVRKLLGSSSRNNDHISKTLNEMLGIKVRWNVLEHGKVVQNFAVVFTFAQLNGQQIRYKLEEQAIKFLSGNFPYANIDLIEQRDLTKACSIPLYEFASRYKGIGATRWLPWQELRDMLVSAENIPNNALKWGSFNERYLQPAIKDVSAHTKLVIQLQTEVVGRAVKNVRLIVDKQRNALDEVALTLGAPQKATLTTALTSLGVTERVMRNMLKAYTEEQIQRAIEHTLKRVNATHLKPLQSPSRYLQASLKEGYYLESTASKQETLFTDSPGAIKPEQTSQKTARQMIEAMVNKQRLMDVKAILGELSEADTEALMTEYNATITVPALRIKKGRNRAGVMPAFQTWYAKKLWGDINDREIALMLERKLTEKK